MKKILMIEDDLELAEILTEYLGQFGFEVVTEDDPFKAVSILKLEPFDLVILDLTLPGMDGLEVCEAIRERQDIPIIISSARSDVTDKVKALELGADDYITKPFSLRELLARIKAILRRVEIPTTQIPVVHIGKLETNFSTYNAYEEGTNVPMSHKEFELLRYLYERRNQTVSRDDILKNVWQQEATTTRTIDNFVVKLRQKIEVNPNEPKIIITVHGIGYKLIQ